MLAGTKHKHDADSGNKPHMLAGDGVALLSALTYGAYAVQVKHEARYLPLATYSPITSYYQWPLANGHLPYSVPMATCRTPCQVPSERAMPMPWLFGLVGLVCCLTLWPSLVIAHLTGLELFRWPTQTVGLMITLNALVRSKS